MAHFDIGARPEPASVGGKGVDYAGGAGAASAMMAAGSIGQRKWQPGSDQVSTRGSHTVHAYPTVATRVTYIPHTVLLFSHCGVCTVCGICVVHVWCMCGIYAYI